MSEENKSGFLLGERQRQFLAFVLCFAGALTLGCLLTFVIYMLNQAFTFFFRSNLVDCPLRNARNFASSDRYFPRRKDGNGTVSFNYYPLFFGSCHCWLGDLVLGREDYSANARLYWFGFGVASALGRER